MSTEEMRRVLVSLEQEALVWDCREGTSRTLRDSIPDVRQGAAAYAASQAGLRRGLVNKFKALWNSTKASTSVSATPEHDGDHTVEEGDQEEEGEGEGEDALEYLQAEDSDSESESEFSPEDIYLDDD